MMVLGRAQQWTAAVKQCIEALVEENDKLEVNDVSSFHQLQSKLYATSHRAEVRPEEISRLIHHLQHLRMFGLFFAEDIGSEADIAPLWGALNLAIQLALREQISSTQLTSWMKGISKQAEVFVEYCKREVPTDAIWVATLDAHVALLQMYVDIVGCFRKNDLPDEQNWERPLTQIFDQATHELSEILQHYEKIADVTNSPRRDIQRLNAFLSGPVDQTPHALDHPRSDSISSNTNDEASLPCVFIPSSRFSIHRSYNRDEILKAISERFNRRSNGLSWIALHGVGGVGKSHIAYKYAYLGNQQKKYDAVLWIPSDTPAAIEQNFTDAAMRLQLPGATPQNHTENKVRVLTWLQQTNCSWLVVYDNAEDSQLLLEYWPETGRGHVIVTTRNHSLAFGADQGIEVPCFEPEGGSKLLLQLLSTDVTNEIVDSDVKSALELSEKLQGHALAISQMAALIHKRNWGIDEFLGMYLKSESRINKRALDTVWRLSFESLDLDSAEFLGVVSYIAPDSIPQALFESDHGTDLPPTMQFCDDQLRQASKSLPCRSKLTIYGSFSDVLEVLMTLALVKRDRGTREFFVHRLVQSQYIDFMALENRQRAFRNAAQLLLNVFPHSGGRLGQLYAHWDRCRLYLQHVITLASHYRQSNGNDSTVPVRERLRSSKPFCRLLAYCCRYLIEQVSLNDLRDMSELAISAYASLGEGGRDLYLDGLIQNQYGWFWYLSGDYQLAELHWRNGLDIHEQIQHPADHRAVAWRSYNMALVAESTGRYEEALRCVEYSEQRWKQSGDDLLSCQACLRSLRAQALTYLGRYSEAKASFDFATRHLKDGKEWGWLAITYLAEGNYHRRLSQFRTAETKYHAAQAAWKTGDQTRVHNFYAACLFKLACVAMDQGSFEAAKEHLDNARSITKLQIQLVTADYNRVLNKLYQLSTLMASGDFDEEVTRDGATIYERVFGRQSDASFVTREACFDSRVNVNWR